MHHNCRTGALVASLLICLASSCSTKTKPPPKPADACDPNPCTETGKTVCTEGADHTSFTCACDAQNYEADGAGGCKELLNVGHPPAPTVTMTGLVVVLDANEAPIAGARVSVSGMSATTDAKGKVRYPHLPTNKRTPATASADGYAPASLVLDARAAFQPVIVHLAKMSPPISVPSSSGGTATLGSRAVSFTPDAFLRADGTPYSGAVSVQLAAATNTEERTPQLLSVGAGRAGLAELRGQFIVTTKGADGADLQLAPDHPAVVHLPIPSDVLALPGDTLQLAYLDTTVGAWGVYSSCVVQPLPESAQSLDSVMECVGTVPHFTPVSIVIRIPQSTEDFDLNVGDAQLGDSFSNPKEWCLNFAFNITKPARCSVSGVQVSTYESIVASTSPLRWTTWGDEAPSGITASVSLNCPGNDGPAFFWKDVTLTESEIKADCSGVLKTLEFNITSDSISVDKDGDGYFTGESTPAEARDCDDTDVRIHPGAEELACNSKDDNCDGITDTATTWDAAGMTPSFWNTQCNATCFQRVTEVPGNAYDEDCNGTVSDADNDHSLATGDTFTGPGYTAGDCDDSNGAVHPGAEDLAGDLIDQDCTNGPHDVDGDGFLSPTELSRVTVEEQTKPDCSDFSADFKPGSTVSEKSLPLLAYYVEDETDHKVHRTAAYCELFDETGALTADARRKLFKDYNCNGQPDDLDGDGWLPYSTPEHPNAWDCNDLDPRVFPAAADMTTCKPADPSLVNDSTCTTKLDAFGGGARPLCPAIPGKDIPSQCVDLVDQNNDPWGVFVCQPTQYNFQDPLDPFAFGKVLGPCDFGVKMPACGAGLQCAGPMTWSQPYLAKLKNDFGYDVAAQEPWLGMCLPKCGDRCSARPSPCGEPHKGACKLVNRQPVCSCDVGYVDSDGTCIPAGTACSASTPYCQNEGTCNETSTEVTCSCPSRYVGAHCDQLANPCEGYTCWHGTCAAVSGAPVCQCSTGWTGDRCMNDVDECLASGVCDEHATCSNTSGSYRCKCDAGYVGSGATCMPAPPLLSEPISCSRTGVNNGAVMLTASFSLALEHATFPYLINGSKTTMFHGISRGTNGWSVSFYPEAHATNPLLKFVDSEGRVLDTVTVPCSW